MKVFSQPSAFAQSWNGSPWTETEPWPLSTKKAKTVDDAQNMSEEHS